MKLIELGDGWHFDLIHISGIACLSTSAICGFIVICITMLKEPKANSIKLFFKLPTGERLVFYLALISMCYSCVHLTDHCYTLYTRQLPPNVPCAIIGFIALTFVIAYQLINAFIALNCFITTVMQKKVDMSRYDLKLLGPCFGIALLVVTVLLAMQHLGPGDAWYVLSCYLLFTTILLCGRLCR